MVDELGASVVARSANSRVGSYAAVTIVEKGDKCSGPVGLKPLKSKHSAARKDAREATKKATPIRKATATKRGASKPKFIEWAHALSS
ncbi:hypothetical protein V6N13_107971 [Hibiscus sabdariffa]